MVTYKTFLRFFGFWNILSHKTKYRGCQNPRVRNGFNFLYTVFVSIIISWLGIYALYKSYEEGEPKYVTSNLFTYLFIVQYYLGWIYFYKPHFEDTIRTSWLGEDGLMIPFMLSLALSTCLTVSSALFLVTGSNINIYSELYDEHQICCKTMVVIFMVLEKFFSYNTFFINTIGFTTIMLTQSDKIAVFANDLKRRVDDLEEFRINTIITDFLILKDSYGETVSLFSNMFSSLTVLGLLGMYFTSINHQTEFVGALQYMNSVCFLIIGCFYIYSVNIVKKSIGKINGVINSPHFATTYLCRTDPDFEKRKRTSIKANKILNRSDSTQILDQLRTINEKSKKLEHLTLHTLSRINESAQMSDWVSLNSKLTQEWESFTLLGFVIDDTTLITKGLTLMSAYFMATNIKSEFGF